MTRPGGRIVMGNWIPNDPTLVAQILKISSSYSPPPPEGFVSPMTWGVEANVIERFAACGSPRREDLVRAGHLHVQLPGRTIGLLAVFRAYYGPTMNAFEAAAAERPRGRAAGRAGGPIQRAEHKYERRRHLHSCNLPTRDGSGVETALRFPRH